MQPPKTHFLMFSCETKIMKITHSEAACRRGIGNCPALIIFFYFEVILRKNGTCMVYKDNAMYMICNNYTPFSTLDIPKGNFFLSHNIRKKLPLGLFCKKL